MKQGFVTPRRRRDHRARRGRPHGRPRVPARRHAHPRQDPDRRPAPAVLGHARQRRGQDRQAVPRQRGAALGRRRDQPRRCDDPPRASRSTASNAKKDLVEKLASGTSRRILFTRTKHHAKKLAKQLTASGHPGRRPARQPLAGRPRPQPGGVRRRGRARSWSRPTSPRAVCTSTTSSWSSTSTRPWSTRRTCTAPVARRAPAARATW